MWTTAFVLCLSGQMPSAFFGSIHRSTGKICAVQLKRSPDEQQRNPPPPPPPKESVYVHRCPKNCIASHNVPEQYNFIAKSQDNYTRNVLFVTDTEASSGFRELSDIYIYIYIYRERERERER